MTLLLIVKCPLIDLVTGYSINPPITVQALTPYVYCLATPLIAHKIVISAARETFPCIKSQLFSIMEMDI